MDMHAPLKADAHSVETFQCGNCDRDFPAKVVTWVDVSRTPQAKRAILQWQFNVVECTHCGCRSFSNTPFFFEDFSGGLLVAVYPRIPENRGEMEAEIREKYGYYPILEYFYDVTQIWGLIYLQEYYRTSKSLSALSRFGPGEERTRRILAFLKESPLMIELREKLTEYFFGDITEDDLADKLNQVIAELEEMNAWPLDQHCICGADLRTSFRCCGNQIALDDHHKHLRERYIIYCPTCKESLTGIACETCGRVYTWNRGTVKSYRGSHRTQGEQRVMPEQAP